MGQSIGYRMLFTILRYDGWVLDHVFQPVADRLAEWWSCYQIAVFLLTVDMLVVIVYFVEVRFYFGLLLIPALIPPVVRAYLAANPPSMLLPLDRFIWWGYRLGAAISIVGDVILPGHLDCSDFWLMTIQVLQFTGTGFLACRPRPPKRREASLWRWKPA